MKYELQITNCKLKKLFLGVFILLSFSKISDSYSQTTDSSSSFIEMGLWQVQELEGQKIKQSKGKKSVLVIQKSRDAFSILTACNFITGKINIQSDKIEFSEIITGKKKCDEKSQLHEQSLITILKSSNKYKLFEGDLYLYKDNTVVGIFKKIAEFKTQP